MSIPRLTFDSQHQPSSKTDEGKSSWQMISESERRLGPVKYPDYPGSSKLVRLPIAYGVLRPGFGRFKVSNPDLNAHFVGAGLEIRCPYCQQIHVFDVPLDGLRERLVTSQCIDGQQLPLFIAPHWPMHGDAWLDHEYHPSVSIVEFGAAAEAVQ